MEITIKPCEAKDLDILEEKIPSQGKSKYHQDRFKEQEKGNSTYLIAWNGDDPLGHLNLRWTGSKDKEVNEIINNCPELNAIKVREEYRSLGIGTRLIKAAEDLIKDRGFKQVGLACSLENQRARDLYLKLGFRDWDKGTYESKWKYINSSDEVCPVTEESIYYLKNL